MTRLHLAMANQLFAPQFLRGPGMALPHVLLVEDAAWCTERPYHQQKLTLVLAAMRHYARELERADVRVTHRRLRDATTLEQAALGLVRRYGFTEVSAFRPQSTGQSRRLERALAVLDLPIHWLPEPAFLTPLDDARRLLGRGRPLMASFYRRQRQRLNLLLEADGKPTGGRWSFDADNRQRLPAHQPTPPLPDPGHDALTRATQQEVARRFPAHPGRADELWLPVERAGARRWLDRFVAERLVGFGTYEDALTLRSASLFHSALAPLLNLGLLTPQQVLDAVLGANATGGVPLNDLEGFVRQLVGWREFVRVVYHEHGADMRAGNAWQAHRRMGPAWAEASTGVLPLDRALANTRRWAWNHHIERLMVIANLQNLCEIEPREAYDFFMANHLDAYDWVMVPNLYGMGLTSDGGVFATKPYLCGSNYLRRMSDYPKGDWCDVVDGLYWRFCAKHRDSLARNPRLRTHLSGLDRMNGGRKTRLFAAAEAFLDAHTLTA